jgi:hypothetical protein
MAVHRMDIDPYRLLAGLGVDSRKVWIDEEERVLYFFPEEWEQVRRYFNWSPSAKAGLYGNWTFEKVPEEVFVDA